MKVTVYYFALLKEAMGTDKEVVELPGEEQTVSDLRDFLMERGAPAVTALANEKRLRFAVNHDLVKMTHPIKDGDEVAFFPPVTGG